MRVVVSAGGTAGHVNPALAVSQALIANGAEVLFAGTPNSFEERLVTAADIPFRGFYSRGFNRRKPWLLPATLLKLSNSRSQAKRWLANVQADVVATFGGYASLPAGLAAQSLGLPLLVHEQNTRPGLANKLLARNADILALSDERAVSSFTTQAKMIVTGNPLREELFGVDRLLARQAQGFSPDARVLLIFGGSLGAHHLNAAMLNNAEMLLDKFADLEVLHITGSADFIWASETLEKKGISPKSWRLRDYCFEMGEAYAAADVVIARAGATTLSELTALGKASLLVPYPFAAADEQTANAERLEKAEAAWVWLDNQLEKQEFTELIFELLENDDLRKRMERSAASLGKPEATSAIAQLILGLDR